MKLFLCRWPNGDLSIVAGRSLEEIDDVLDEVGDGHAAELIRVSGRFALHLKLKEAVGDADEIDQLLEVQEFDECSFDRLGDAYPILHSALGGAVDLEDETEGKHAPMSLEAALTEERDRKMRPEKCRVLDDHCYMEEAARAGRRS